MYKNTVITKQSIIKSFSFYSLSLPDKNYSHNLRLIGICICSLEHAIVVLVVL